MKGAPSRPRLHASGDSLVLVELEARLDPAINRRAVAIAQAIEAAAVPGVRDVVPSYACVGIHVDPLRLDAAALDRAVEAAWAATPVTGGVDEGRLVEIPVCYGGAHGPDLDEVAAFAHASPDEVVRRHSAATYRVYMLGFLPGFAYLGVVDATIAMPRRPAPRAEVPAGSVGIAGQQTGVYPSNSPGGWRLIGRTPWRMFEAGRPRPSLLTAGDRVRFVPVPPEHWERFVGGPS
ncbi:MAG: 5-oxoprolinase subunit PxpB [Vicinamibacterales bacterium]